MSPKQSAARPTYRSVHPDHSWVLDMADQAAFKAERAKLMDAYIDDPTVFDDKGIAGRKHYGVGFRESLDAANEAGERLAEFEKADAGYRMVRAISGGAFEPTV